MKYRTPPSEHPDLAAFGRPASEVIRPVREDDGHDERRDASGAPKEYRPGDRTPPGSRCCSKNDLIELLSPDAAAMSAFLPLATTERTSPEVRFVPEAEDLKLSLFRSQHQQAQQDRYNKQRGHVRN
jgi:hypothetical protein